MKWSVLILLLTPLNLQAQEPARYDVVIHEFFADPTPSRGMPPYEFIELRNRSGSAWNLRNWTISSSTTTGRINSNYILQPDSMLILCSSGAVSAYQLLGPTLAVSSFPALDNDGDTLLLRTASGKLMHAIAWNKNWYSNGLKQEGGFSIEMMDDGHPCLGAENWKASSHERGATPGKTNSVKTSIQDTKRPKLLFAYFRDSITLQLVMDKTLAETGAGELLVNGSSPSGQTILPPLFNTVEAVLPTAQKKEQQVEIVAKGHRDCSGNQMTEVRKSAGVFSDPVPADLVINEVLFDPPPDGYDYVELYNTSPKNIDVSQLRIANRGTDGKIASITRLRTTPYPLLPGEYLLVTEDSSWIRKHYGLDSLSRAAVPSPLPSFPDDAGEVILLDRQGEVLDELRYNRKWHFDLVADPRGVSLERISPFGPTQNASNWHSASTSSGFGTPGYRNSQCTPESRSLSAISLSSRIISSIQDGRDDFLLIHYKFPAQGNVLTLRVFNTAGQTISVIANNALCGSTGSYKWDGKGLSNRLLPTGNYIISATYFDPSGGTGKQNMVVAIVR